MQKLFPNFTTIDQDKQPPQEMVEPVTFRKLEGGEDEERLFKELFEKQRQKYEAIFCKYMITERPQRFEIK
jgi:hypothetical protein